MGATLLSDDGSTVYGVLEQISGGTFSIALSWLQIHQVAPIEFAGSEERALRVEVIDTAANVASEMLSLTLWCEDGGACDGECLPLDTNDACGMCGVVCDENAECTGGRCVTICGNGRIDPGEQCDGDNLQGFTCIDLGIAGGTLGCTSECTYDTSMCG